MNVGRLLEFIDELLDRESVDQVQAKLGKLSTQLQNLVAQPQDATHQSNVNASLNNLRSALQTTQYEITPATNSFLLEYAIDWAFSEALTVQISEQMAASGITPAVVKAFVDQLLQKRKNILDNFRELKLKLEFFGFSRPQS